MKANAETITKPPAIEVKVEVAAAVPAAGRGPFVEIRNTENPLRYVEGFGYDFQISRFFHKIFFFSRFFSFLFGPGVVGEAWATRGTKK